MVKKNKYTKSGSEKELKELGKEIAKAFSKTSSVFDKFKKPEPEVVEEVPITKTALGDHVERACELYGAMSATKAVTVINNEFNVAYTIPEIEEIWAIIAEQNAENEAEG